MTTPWFKAQQTSGAGRITLMSDIGEFGITAADFRVALASLGSVKRLDIDINSNGGDVTEGFAVYNMLARHPARKIVTVLGLAASMASVIAMVGDEVIMPSNAMLMIHNPFGGAIGNASTIKSFGEALDVMQSNIRDVYARRTGLPSAQIAQMMDAETWLSAARSVELGFADRTIDPIRAAAVSTARFRHPPTNFGGTRVSEIDPAAIYAKYNRRRPR